jgi:hypothetical protein
MKVVVKRRDVTDLHELQALVVDHVDGIEPGLTVLDSRLLLGQATIDVVGLDAQGALVLIAVAFTADEEMLLKAVEAYSWCLEYPEAIRRLYPSAHISASQPPRLMFVVQRMPDAFHRKIKQLGFPVVDCVEVRSLEVDGRSAVYFETLARLRRTSAPAAPERTTAPAPPTNGRPTSLKLQRLLGADRAAHPREPAPVVRMPHRSGPRGEAAKPVLSIARREATAAPRGHDALKPAPAVTSTDDNAAVAMAVADKPAELEPMTVAEPIVAAHPIAAAPLIAAAEPAPAAAALIAVPEPTPSPAPITAGELTPTAALLASVEPVGARDPFAEPVTEVEPIPAPAFATDPVATALMSTEALAAEPDALPARATEALAWSESTFEPGAAPTASPELAAPEPARAAVEPVAPPAAATDPELHLGASATDEPEPALTAMAAAFEMPARAQSLDTAVVEPIAIDPARVEDAAVEPQVAAAPSAPSVFSRRSAEPAAVTTEPRISFANVAKDLLTATAERPAAFAKPAVLFTRPGAAKPPRTIAPPPSDPNPIAGGKPGAAAKRVEPPVVGGAPERAAASAGAPETTVPVPPEGFEALRFPHDGVLTRQWMEFLNQMAAGK